MDEEKINRNKVQLSIDFTSFSNHYNYLNIFEKLISFVLLESHGRVEYQGGKYFRKKNQR